MLMLDWYIFFIFDVIRVFNWLLLILVIFIGLMFGRKILFLGLICNVLLKVNVFYKWIWMLLFGFRI